MSKLKRGYYRDLLAAGPEFQFQVFGRGPIYDGCIVRKIDGTYDLAYKPTYEKHFKPLNLNLEAIKDKRCDFVIVESTYDFSDIEWE